LKFKVLGNLNIHGVERPHDSDLYIWEQDDELHMSTVFIVKVEDHDIEIPKIVIMNIAEEVEVTANFKFLINE